jgi:hypothetical protein
MLDLIEEQALIKMLEQPATEKAKEADAFTCRYKGCNRKYTDATSSGAKSKKNCGFCSSKCREAAKKAKEAEAFTCRGCTGKYTDGSGSGSGTKYNCGYCSSKCREAPRAYAPRTQCEHGRQKHKSKDCSPKSSCQHGRLKGRCKDCGTGDCQRGRLKHRRMDCR